MDRPSIGSVHISHAPQDGEYARRLVEHLTGAGIPTTYDREPEAALPRDVVRAKIDVSRGVVVVMSAAAKDAPRVRAQFERADERDVPVVPLLLSGEPIFALANLDYTDVTGGQMPPEYVVQRLRRIVLGQRDEPTPPHGFRPVPADVDERTPDTAPGRTRSAVPVAAFVGVVVLLIVVAGIALWTNRDKGPVKPEPTAVTNQALSQPPSVQVPSSTASTAGTAGAVQIAAPLPDAVVPRCMKVSGTADLPGEKTLLFATNRTMPADDTWYFSYAAGHRNGFVDKTWSGEVYLGSVTKQRYDLFVVIMDAKAALAFYNGHLSTDGKFAYAKELPADGKVAAHLNVTQGTNDEC